MTDTVTNKTSTNKHVVVDVVEDMRVFTLDAESGNPIVFGARFGDGKKKGSKSILIYKHSPGGVFEQVGTSVYLEDGFNPGGVYPNKVIEKFTRLAGVPDDDFPVIITMLARASKLTLDDIAREVELALDSDASIHPVIDFDPDVGMIFGTTLHAHTDIQPKTVHISRFGTFYCQNGDSYMNSPLSIRIEYPRGRIPPVNNEVTQRNVLRLYRDVGNLEKKANEGDIGEGKSVCPQEGAPMVFFQEDNPVLEQIERKTRYYLYLSFRDDDDNEVEGLYLISSLWLLGTYIFPVFPTYPYLFYVGPREVGKSTFLELAYHIGFNATEPEILPTAPLLYRTIESTRALLLIDECQKIFAGGRTEEGDGASVSAVLESGFHETGIARRLRQEASGADYDIDVFHVYSPKLLASRRELDIQEKSITIPAVEAPVGEGFELRTATLHKDKEFQDISYNCLKWGIAKAKKVSMAYDELKPEPPFTGRQFDLWGPLLAICQVICPERMDELKNIAGHLIKSHQSRELADAVLLAIAALPRDTNPTPDDIIEKMGSEYEKIRSSTIGNILRVLKVIRTKLPGTPTKYRIRWDAVDKRIEARRLKDTTTKDDKQSKLPPDEQEIANALEGWRRKHYFDKYPVTPERWASAVIDSPDFPDLTDHHFEAVNRIAKRKFDEAKLDSDTSPTAVERAEKAIKLKLGSWNTATQGEPSDHLIAKLVKLERSELNHRQLAILARDLIKGGVME